MSYLKDMKNESIEIMLHSSCKKFLQDRKCSFSDLSSLTDEDIINFKELFFENRVSKFHRGTGKMMETLYDYIIDILNRRVPVDGTNVKVDQIINKVKLVEIPEDVILETIHETVEVERDGQKFEERVEKKRNTNEKGVILLKVN
jgi:hypothetical protein